MSLCATFACWTVWMSARRANTSRQRCPRRCSSQSGVWINIATSGPHVHQLQRSTADPLLSCARVWLWAWLTGRKTRAICHSASPVGLGGATAAGVPALQRHRCYYTHEVPRGCREIAQHKRQKERIKRRPFRERQFNTGLRQTKLSSVPRRWKTQRDIRCECLWYKLLRVRTLFSSLLDSDSDGRSENPSSIVLDDTFPLWRSKRLGSILTFCREKKMIPRTNLSVALSSAWSSSPDVITAVKSTVTIWCVSLWTVLFLCLYNFKHFSLPNGCKEISVWLKLELHH